MVRFSDVRPSSFVINLCPSDGTLNVSPLLRITNPWHAKDRFSWFRRRVSSWEPLGKSWSYLNNSIRFCIAEILPIRRKRPSNKFKNKTVKIKIKRMLKGKSYEFFLNKEEQFELCEVDSFRWIVVYRKLKIVDKDYFIELYYYGLGRIKDYHAISS